MVVHNFENIYPQRDPYQTWTILNLITVRCCQLALALRDDDKELVDACLVCLLRVRADTDHLIPKFVKAEDLLEVVRARIVELERSSTL